MSHATKSGRLPCFFNCKASFPHSVVLPAPCNPHIIITVGSLELTSNFALPVPINAINSSFTILMTCCAGFSDSSTCCPTAFSETSLINCFATLMFTSASKSAMRTSRIAERISNSVSFPRLVSLENMWLSRSESEPNNAILFPFYKSVSACASIAFAASCA